MPRNDSARVDLPNQNSHRCEFRGARNPPAVCSPHVGRRPDASPPGPCGFDPRLAVFADDFGHAWPLGQWPRVDQIPAATRPVGYVERVTARKRRGNGGRKGLRRDLARRRRHSRYSALSRGAPLSAGQTRAVPTETLATAVALNGNHRSTGCMSEGPPSSRRMGG